MLLFEISSKKYLHCGDFRMSEDMLTNPLLVNVDTLFLDTTYADRKFDFPTQAEVCNTAVNIAIRVRLFRFLSFNQVTHLYKMRN